MAMKRRVPDPRLPLEYAVQKNPPPRPTRTDEAVIRRTAESIVDEVMAVEDGDGDREGYLADLIAALRRAPDDGFAMGNYLKDYHHWGIDMALCEIFDSVLPYGALHEMIAEWVDANQIRPQFAVGDAVRVAVRWRRSHTLEGNLLMPDILPGIITGIYPDRAQYVVKTAENTREGSGFLINYEDTQADPDAAPAQGPAGERPGGADPAAAAGVLQLRAEPEIDVLPEQPDRGSPPEGRLVAWEGWILAILIVLGLISLISGLLVAAHKMDADVKKIMQEMSRPK